MIGIGGFFGSILRYLLSGFVQGLSGSISFPYGTFIVNLTGCFFIGLLSHLSESMGLFSGSSRAFVFVGVLGGFTTFSAFSNETFNLLRDGERFVALLNMSGQVVIGLAFVWFGRVAAFCLWR